MTNVEKLVTVIRGRPTTEDEINKKELMKVVRTSLSRKEALVIKWRYGLNGNEPKEFKDIPLQRICESGINLITLRIIELVALRKLGETKVLLRYIK